jgi:uncharacterized protein YndB with AHSA1/START domain/DNA-binding transcriptional ArsR family regulator
MVEYSNKSLSELLKAVSDTTRLSLLTELCQQGPSRVTDLANSYAMSLNAVSKHIKVLEKAGLVSRTTIGRTHLIEADLAKTSEIEHWLKQLKSIWEIRLDKLDEIIQMENPNMTELTVNVVKTIDVPIEKVFDAWLDAQMLAKFMLPALGMPEPQTKTDAKEGGRFTIIMQVGDDKLPHTGEYLEIVRPDRLVFTWESPFSADNSIVTLNFIAVEGNKTSVELTHVKFLDEQSRANHEGGWGNILEKLDEVISRA